MVYNSTDMALDAILWLKQDKRCYLHCTEYGYSWTADAIGYNGKDLIEVEVKTSWSDFQADFRNKKKKHQVLLDAFEKDKLQKGFNYIPNYMYYLVTPELQEKAVKYIKENKLPYGVMVYNKRKPANPLFGGLESVHKVKRIHKESPSNRQIQVMTARMSNEYIYAINLSRSTLINNVTSILDKNLREALRLAGEDTQKSIENFLENSVAKP